AHELLRAAQLVGHRCPIDLDVVSSGDVLTIPDGDRDDERRVRVRLLPFMWQAGPALLVLLNEFTDEYRAARRREHADRESALAQLARSVAHDFNNMMQIVSASAQTLGQSLESYGMDGEAHAIVEDIHEVVRAARDLTRRLSEVAAVPDDDAG